MKSLLQLSTTTVLSENDKRDQLVYASAINNHFFCIYACFDIKQTSAGVAYYNNITLKIYNYGSNVSKGSVVFTKKPVFLPNKKAKGYAQNLNLIVFDLTMIKPDQVTPELIQQEVQLPTNLITNDTDVLLTIRNQVTGAGQLDERPLREPWVDEYENMWPGLDIEGFEDAVKPGEAQTLAPWNRCRVGVIKTLIGS